MNRREFHTASFLQLLTHRVCYLKGFESKREALRFEWWWKRRSAKLQGTPLEKRQAAMEAMMSEWPGLEVA